MVIKLPALKKEEGRKFLGPSLQTSQRASILLELVEALRLNGELVRNAMLSSLGTGAHCRLRIGPGTRFFGSTHCFLVHQVEGLFDSHVLA